jgi:hypothetical protein
MKERESGIVGDEVELELLESTKHDDILHHVGGQLPAMRISSKRRPCHSESTG